MADDTMDEKDKNELATAIAEKLTPKPFPIPRRHLGADDDTTPAPKAHKSEWTKYVPAGLAAAAVIASASVAIAQTTKVDGLEARLRAVETASAVNASEHKTMIEALNEIKKDVKELIKQAPAAPVADKPTPPK